MPRRCPVDIAAYDAPVRPFPNYCSDTDRRFRTVEANALVYKKISNGSENQLNAPVHYLEADLLPRL